MTAGALAAPMGAAPGSEDRAARERGLPDPQITALNELKRDDRGRTNVTFQNGFPRAVSTSVAVVGDTPVERATSFLRTYKDLYGQFMADPFDRSGFEARTIRGVNALPDADPDMGRRDFLLEMRRFQGKPISTPDLDLSLRATSGPDDQIVAFRQTYKGVPVFGADLLVFLRGARVVGTVGGLLTDADLSVRPRLDDAAALARAARALRASPQMAPLGRTHLVVFDPGLMPGEASFRDPQPRLAWRIAAGDPLGSSVLIDARNGQLLVESPGTRGHTSDRELDLETANGNNAKDSNCYWDTSDNDALGDEDGLNSDGQADPAAVKAFNLWKQTYNFFHNTFGRHSFDGDDAELEVYVHATPPPAGNIAAWKGGANSFDCDLIDFRNGGLAFDVFAHELAHGVSSFSLFGGLTYQNQSGALEESHSDTMGAMADGNWLVGEGTAGGAIRDMSNPPAFGDPDRFGNGEFVNTGSDNGGVHTNSGIVNKVAFLIADGGTHPDTGVTVTAIGKPILGWLTYMSMLNEPQNTGFSDARALMIAFASTKYPTWVVCQVRNAWFAVDVGSPDITCDGSEDNPDVDGDGVPFGQDNCPGKANPSQLDTDADGKGNACDGDSDEDGVPELGPIHDNCPGVPNPDQTDENLNGIGKACDPTEDEDFDDDGVLNPDDNCFLDANANQADVDNDGDGDACDPDTDGDGWSNDNDNAPFEPNPGQEDTDGDGIGDVSDDCPGTADQNVAWTAGIPELGIDPQPVQPDSDGDGVPDACDRAVLINGSEIGWQNVLKPDGRARAVRVDGAPATYLKIPISPTDRVDPGDHDAFGQGARRVVRSEERRVGKECRSRWSPYH